MHTSRTVISIVILALVAFSVNVGAKARDLSGLAWIAGNWSGVQGGVEMEEFWQEPKGNTMLGLHRDVAGGRTVSFEFLRIEATAEAITYWASPRGRPATPFRLTEQKDKRAVFENAKHDFPQRVIYWLSDDGALHAKIEGTMNGKPTAEEWTWRRAPREKLTKGARGSNVKGERETGSSLNQLPLSHLSLALSLNTLFGL